MSERYLAKTEAIRYMEPNSSLQPPTFLSALPRMSTGICPVARRISSEAFAELE